MADDAEAVLLHEPDLMLALLRAASEAPAAPEAAFARLLANVRAAGEPPPDEPAELRARLCEAAALLLGAGALIPAGDGLVGITPRGRQLLNDYPDGVDQSVLHAFPEFRAFVAARSYRAKPEDARLPAFEAGMHAFSRGLGNDANPHATDSADHLAWECGWAEARDEAKRA